MKHWIVMFRPETYVAAREHGMMAVLHNHRRRFAEIAPGDRFVAYISRQRVLDAHGEATSEPFQEVSDVPAGWIRYTERARIRFDQTGAGMSEIQFQQYWIGQVFRGRASSAPRAVPDARTALALVATPPGALALVDASIADPRVRVLAVDGLRPDAAGYALR